MDLKWKILVVVSLLVNISAVGFLGYNTFQKQGIFENKATVTTTEQKPNEISYENNLKAESIPVMEEQQEQAEEAVEEEKEAAKEEPKETKKEEEKVETKKISLSGKKNSSGVSLSWSASDLGSFDGFKIVKSKNSNPVYPGDDYKYVTDKKTRSYSWKITTGSKYHFRVCQYAGGKCVLYSNDIYLDTPESSDDDEDEKDESSKNYASGVSLSLSEDGGYKYLSWSISGGDAPLGYKVVKSKDSNPEYPADGYYRYISDGGTKKVKLEGFSSGDNYHFRVCIYKGGSCGAYSNDLSVSF